MSVLKPSEIASHIRLLLSSYQRLTGKVLIDVSNLSDDSLVTTLDKVPFVLVSL